MTATARDGASRSAGVGSACDLPSRALLPFVVLTFAITWGVIAPWIFAPAAVTPVLGEISGTHPAFLLATWGPSLAGVALVLFHTGWAGLRAFLSRLALWRAPPGWVAFVLLGIPAIYALGALLKGNVASAPLLTEPPRAVLAVLLFMALLGPMEEFGWRGVAQPILQRHVPPVAAGALIGLVWGIWHLPAFLLSGTSFAEWSFLPFLAGNVALAVIVTPLFNASRGGLLWPMLFHWQLINPAWPDAQPWDIPIFLAVAAFVAWRVRHVPGVTRVVPAPLAAAPGRV